jgi:acetylornithine deacetylase/succinyl-diaminopimelate desuccinylase-like protein
MNIVSQEEVFGYIEKNRDAHLGYVKELVNQPSISTQNIGITECAEKVRQMMDRVGLKAKLLPTRGNPVVFGEYRSPRAKQTILFYNHYDVQPPEPLEQWVSEPFKPEIREGKLFGRGTSDNKGTLASRIAAFESILKVTGECPVNVKFIVEGEEEIGSPNLESFAASHKEKLSADAIIWEGSDRHPSERPTITLGNKGMLYLELRTKGPKTDQHSSRASMLPNPAWTMVWALSTMKSPDGKATIDGYYDNIRKQSKISESLLDMIPLELEKEKALAGISHLIGEEDPSKMKRALFLEPTITINGLSSGYSSKGMKTIVPAQALAKIDIRLVPDQDPDEIFGKVKDHLKKLGFDEVEVKQVAKMRPSRTDPETLIVKVTIEQAKRIYGIDPIVYTNSMGSGAMYVAVNTLKTPVVAVGAAYYGSGMHSPNEHIRVDDYLLATKLIVAILINYPQAA